MLIFFFNFWNGNGSVSNSTFDGLVFFIFRARLSLLDLTET